MRYIKPKYYDDFKCIADKCPDTCCAGWQIVIDEASIKRYEKEASSFCRCLQNSIDWQEGVFRQKENNRCAFLNEQNLCDLYTALGPESLCDTCRDYPRHTEEFEGLRELSLSLSCPVAAEMILSQKQFPEFVEYETDEPEELADEFEDFDFLMFTQLEEARKVSFEILKNSNLDFDRKVDKILSLAKEMDICVEEGRFSDIDNVIYKYEINDKTDYIFESDSNNCINALNTNRYNVFKKNFAVLEEMELLRDDWKDVRLRVWKCLYSEDEEHYNRIVQHFNEKVKKEGIEGIPLEQIASNLLMTFIYVWFCGAVYSGWVYCKIAMAVFCTYYILEFIMAKWVERGENITFADCIEITYRFTREVEHSDINLGILEEWFIDELS